MQLICCPNPLDICTVLQVLACTHELQIFGCTATPYNATGVWHTGHRRMVKQRPDQHNATGYRCCVCERVKQAVEGGNAPGS